MTPASYTDYKRKGAYSLCKKRFEVALGCMATRNKSELMICRVQFIRKTNEVATQASCPVNARGFYSKHGCSWFNRKMMTHMFRSYKNCYNSSSEPVTDEEDEFCLWSNL